MGPELGLPGGIGDQELAGALSWPPADDLGDVRGGDLLDAAPDHVEHYALAEERRYRAEAIMHIHVEVKRDSLGDRVRALLRFAAPAEESMRGTRALDREAGGARVTSVVPIGETDVMEDACHIEKLLVVLDAVAGGKQSGKRPCPQTVPVEDG